MLVWSTILAVLTLAELCALQSCTEALTILFAAHRFFAGTFSDRSPGRYTLEVARMPVIGQHLGLQDLHFLAWLVMAAGALAGAGTLTPI